MLRIYFLQQWFNLSDPQAEDAIYDSESVRRFAGVELSEDVVPDETTILRFRHLLEEHHLTAAIFAAVRGAEREHRRIGVCGPTGRVSHETRLFERAAITATVFTTDEVTPFTRMGDVIGWLAALSSVGAGVVLLMRHR